MLSIFRLIMVSFGLVSFGSRAMEPLTIANIFYVRFFPSYQASCDFVREKLKQGPIPLAQTKGECPVFGKLPDAESTENCQKASADQYEMALMCDDGVCKLIIEKNHIIDVQGLSMQEFHNN